MGGKSNGSRQYYRWCLVGALALGRLDRVLWIVLLLAFPTVGNCDIVLTISYFGGSFVVICNSDKPSIGKYGFCLQQHAERSTGIEGRSVE